MTRRARIPLRSSRLRACVNAFCVMPSRQRFIVHALMASLIPFDTTHSVNNPRVAIDGDKAVLDALVEAQHVLKTDHARHYLMKNRYDVRLVKQGETWLIQHIIVDNVWRAGDASLMAGV